MNLKLPVSSEIPTELVEAIRSFPLQRVVQHCGKELLVSPFDMYATCPECRCQIKLRSSAAGQEIKDLFDAFFDWLNQPGALELAKKRQEVIARDNSE
jgi:hypothetical protein